MLLLVTVSHVIRVHPRAFYYDHETFIQFYDKLRLQEYDGDDNDSYLYDKDHITMVLKKGKCCNTFAYCYRPTIITTIGNPSTLKLMGIS